MLTPRSLVKDRKLFFERSSSNSTSTTPPATTPTNDDGIRRSKLIENVFIRHDAAARVHQTETQRGADRQSGRSWDEADADVGVVKQPFHASDVDGFSKWVDKVFHLESNRASRESHTSTGSDGADCPLSLQEAVYVTQTWADNNTDDGSSDSNAVEPHQRLLDHLLAKDPTRPPQEDDPVDQEQSILRCRQQDDQDELQEKECEVEQNEAKCTNRVQSRTSDSCSSSSSYHLGLDKNETIASQELESVEDSKLMKKRYKIVNELLETEKQYIKNLNILMNYHDFAKENWKKEAILKIDVIFRYVKDFYTNHCILYVELKKSGQDLSSIAKSFLKLEHAFTNYTFYTRNKPESDTIMSYFKDWFRVKQEQLQHNLDLSSYLLVPIQRLVKYAQLLKKLAKTGDQMEISIMEKAIHLVELTIKQGETYLLLDCVKGFNMDPVHMGCKILQCSFAIGESKKKNITAILVESGVILTRINGSNHSDMTFEDFLSLDEYTLNEWEHDDLRFELYKTRSQQGFVFNSPSSEGKARWVDAIKTILWAQLEREKEMNKSRQNSSIIPQRVSQTATRKTSASATQPIARVTNERISLKKKKRSNSKKLSTSTGEMYKSKFYDEV